MSAIILVPVGSNSEKLLDRDDKKARLSVKMWTGLFTPSSYLIEAPGIERKDEVFLCPAAPQSRTIVPAGNLSPANNPSQLTRACTAARS